VIGMVFDERYHEGDSGGSRHRSFRGFKVILGVVLVLALGLGVYYFVSRTPADNDAVAAQGDTIQQDVAAEPAPEQPDAQENIDKLESLLAEAEQTLAQVPAPAPPPPAPAVDAFSGCGALVDKAVSGADAVLGSVEEFRSLNPADCSAMVSVASKVKDTSVPSLASDIGALSENIDEYLSREAISEEDRSRFQSLKEKVGSISLDSLGSAAYELVLAINDGGTSEEISKMADGLAQESSVVKQALSEARSLI